MRTNLRLSITVGLALTSSARADTLAATAPPDAPSEPARRWLVLEATSEPVHYDGARGLRAELDLANLDGWIVGAAASYAHAVIDVYGGLIASLHTRDIKAIAYVARTAGFRHWELRGALGAGAIRTAASAEAFNGPRMEWVEDTGVFPTAEASLRATVPISPHWAVTGGAIATYMNQWFHLEGGTNHREAELVFSLGVARDW